MKMPRKTAFVIATAGLAWLLVTAIPARAQGQTWAGGNLQRMIEEARWRLGALRINAAFLLARTGYDSDIYYGFFADPVPDVTSSASLPIEVLLPLSKKAVIEVSDSPEYVFFLDSQDQRTLNNRLNGRVHIALDKIYVQAAGGLSDIRRRFSPELDLHVRQKTNSLSTLVLWQASRISSLALLYSGSQHAVEDIFVDGVSLADRLNRNEEFVDLITYFQPSVRVRLSFDGQYGSYQFRRSYGRLRDSTSYAFFAGAEFIPGERDIEFVKGLRGAVALGYMRFDFRDPLLKDGSGLVGEASLQAYLMKKMTGRITFSRGFQFSVYSGLSSYLLSTVNAGLTRHLSRKASLSYDFTYGQTSYTGAEPGQDPHFYRYLTHGLSLDLRLARHLSTTIYGSFGQRDRGGVSPLRDRFFAGLSLTYGSMGQGMSMPTRGGIR